MLKKVFKELKYFIWCIFATLYLEPKNRYDNGYYVYSIKKEKNKF